ncbi:MAG: zinc ribbon domain-containing protein [Deltaproteobacteria bacterium]|nr:zinc ribbon domain-containing protein [Deltaproteobacteria bacterium]
MPIYEYRCPKCGEFEVTQRITESPLKKCPTCKAKVTKLISSTSFQLKGSGWYITDYGRSGSKSEGKSETKSENKSESKGDSKPAESKASESKTSESKPSEGKSTKSQAKAA